MQPDVIYISLSTGFPGATSSIGKTIAKINEDTYLSLLILIYLFQSFDVSYPYFSCHESIILPQTGSRNLISNLEVLKIL